MHRHLNVKLKNLLVNNYYLHKRNSMLLLCNKAIIRLTI